MSTRRFDLASLPLSGRSDRDRGRTQSRRADELHGGVYGQELQSVHREIARNRSAMVVISLGSLGRWHSVHRGINNVHRAAVACHLIVVAGLIRHA